MQALILAGGKGTRLGPLTVYTPKPIVPICNRPFLLYQIDTLRPAGVTDITLSLSYQPETIEQSLGDGSNLGVRLKYIVEPQRTYWMDIGTPARYLQTHFDLLANRVKRIHIKDRRGKFDSATHSEIDELSIIADECTIKPGAQIINSVLGKGCYVEERARIE